MCIPSPLPLQLVETESSPEYLADEMLALTKTDPARRPQADHHTRRRPRREILRHLGPCDRPQGRYACYM